MSLNEYLERYYNENGQYPSFMNTNIEPKDKPDVLYLKNYLRFYFAKGNAGTILFDDGVEITKHSDGTFSLNLNKNRGVSQNQLVLINGKQDTPPSILKLDRSWSNSVWKADDREVSFPMGRFVASHNYDGLLTYRFTGFPKSVSGSSSIEVYMFAEYVLVYVDHVPLAFVFTNPKRIADVKYLRLFSEELFRIQYAIRSRQSRDDCIATICPRNSIISLDNIDKLRTGRWFATTKIDGETALVAYIAAMHRLLIIRLHNKLVHVDGEIDVVYRDDDTNLGTSDQLFLGEWTEDRKIYLFLEVNDIDIDFHRDIANIDAFLKLVSGEKYSFIRKNNIVIDKPYQDLTRDIEQLRKMFQLNDGIVYGNVDTKEHYKWKPVSQNTIDFYADVDRDTVRLYTHIQPEKTKDIIRGPKYRYSRDPYAVIKKPGLDYILWTSFHARGQEKYHGKIVECQYVDRRWNIYRERPDKIHPQNHFVAIRIMKTINNPIALGDLMK